MLGERERELPVPERETGWAEHGRPSLEDHSFVSTVHVCGRILSSREQKAWKVIKKTKKNKVSGHYGSLPWSTSISRAYVVVLLSMEHYDYDLGRAGRHSVLGFFLFFGFMNEILLFY